MINHASGNFNTAIGDASGISLITGSSNIYIGSVTVGNTESNTYRMGNASAITSNFQQGIFGTTIGGSGIPVSIDNTGKLGTTVSSIKYKENINDIPNVTDNIMKLRPVEFNYISNKDKIKVYGLIAEEVEQVIPDMVVYNNGQLLTVRYDYLNTLLLKELQEQRKEINTLYNLITKNNLII